VRRVVDRPCWDKKYKLLCIFDITAIYHICKRLSYKGFSGFNLCGNPAFVSGGSVADDPALYGTPAILFKGNISWLSEHRMQGSIRARLTAWAQAQRRLVSRWQVINYPDRWDWVDGYL